MNERNKLPEVPSTALRDHATDERVDRIWQRLEGNLGTNRPRQPRALLWAPAAMLIVFGAGVFVGARWVKPANVATTVSAEPMPAGDEPPRPAPGLPNAQPVQPDEPTQSKDKKPLGVPHSGLSGAEQPGEPGVEPAPPTAVMPPVVATQPEWEALADNNEYMAAWQALDKQGGFDAVLAKAGSATQLMTLYDVARMAKQHASAIAALRAVVQNFPKDPRAPIAAYTLGMALEKAGDRAGAAQAFADYRALSPKGDFAEDALARQISAAIAANNVDLAKQLAEQYAKDFPKSSKLGSIRARVAKLTGEDAGAAAGAPDTHVDEAPFDEIDEEPLPKPGKKP